MSKSQILVLSLSLILFIVLYFGCETKPKQIRELETSRSLTMQVTGIENILSEAKKRLNPDQLNTIETLTAQIGEDSARATMLEMLSSKWYEFGDLAIAGHYAEELATLRNDEMSWSIAGTTYTLGLKNAMDDKIRQFSKSKALAAFEKALSINPANIDHKINMALCYVEMPDESQPMKGILMLRELNELHPENVNVLIQLARLALRTNQLEKATDRLNQALKLDKNNKAALCLFSEVYLAAGDKEKAAYYRDKCSN
ncbi:MAG: hypothetical protein IPN29_17925 [Saprospiraceae bacterium]|nr:hypothetical protein [Saprospiraceae bacterium]